MLFDDHEIARLAGRQLGVVTRVQLLALGLTSGAIKHRLRAGRLHAVHRGVYSAGHAALAPDALELAAVLVCGPGAVLSHRSAAALWELLPEHRGPVEVTLAKPHRHGPAGIVVHESAAMPPREVRLRHGVPVTSPARTLLDLAASRAAGLERAVNEAYARRLAAAAELETLARSGRRGSRALRAIVDDPPSITRSEAERRLLALLRRARLPLPQTNLRIGGYEVDAYWPAHRLVVEVDGYAFHSGRASFERDRLRDADLQSEGLRVLRITWRQLTATPEALAARLGAALTPTGPRTASDPPSPSPAQLTYRSPTRRRTASELT